MIRCEKWILALLIESHWIYRSQLSFSSSWGCLSRRCLRSFRSSVKGRVKCSGCSGCGHATVHQRSTLMSWTFQMQIKFLENVRASSRRTWTSFWGRVDDEELFFFFFSFLSFLGFSVAWLSCQLKTQRSNCIMLLYLCVSSWYYVMFFEEEKANNYRSSRYIFSVYIYI